MEELSCLAEGQKGLRVQGWDYLLGYLDWFPDAPALNHAAEIMLPAERRAVADVLARVLRFREEAGHGASRDRLIQLGRADEIALHARKTLGILNARGRFNEDAEEEEPTGGKQPA